MTTAAVRNLTCALVIFVADVLIGAGQATHFDGLSVLLIIGVDAALWLALVAVPNVVAAWRSQRLLIDDAYVGAPILYWRDRDQGIIDTANAAQVKL